MRTNHRRGRKGEIELATEAREREARDKEAATAENVPPEGQNVKVTAPVPSGDTSAANPDRTAHRRSHAGHQRIPPTGGHAIDSTQRGVASLRKLNGDQNKTVVQIRSFLEQAQRALHNGDVDGAHTLATKAKTLLDELTGAS